MAIESFSPCNTSFDDCKESMIITLKTCRYMKPPGLLDPTFRPKRVLYIHKFRQHISDP